MAIQDAEDKRLAKEMKLKNLKPEPKLMTKINSQDMLDAMGNSEHNDSCDSHSIVVANKADIKVVEDDKHSQKHTAPRTSIGITSPNHLDVGGRRAGSIITSNSPKNQDGGKPPYMTAKTAQLSPNNANLMD